MFRKISFALTAAFLCACGANAQEWGTLSGQVLWADGALPQLAKVNINKDQDHCLSMGEIPSEKFVVNPKNKGVRWVMVWLTDAKDPKVKLPVHPSLEKAVSNDVVLDQPCCKFEPHVVGIREGQTLVTKNSSPITHNVSIISTGKNPNSNQIVPSSKEVRITDWFQGRTPSRIECTIHPWMGAYVWTFSHPYFAVTNEEGKFTLKNAPAGEFNLVTWQEETGFVQGGRVGIPVKIKAGATTEVTIDLKPGK
ncbi:MAG: carboxypeptidase regulatory-like domain-containing protein [Planctomycetota bacterium]|nr:carboxypeptidase regulatory-like domain-containing protein [Planctomycetota bacterium]